MANNEPQATKTIDLRLATGRTAAEIAASTDMGNKVAIASDTEAVTVITPTEKKDILFEGEDITVGDITTDGTVDGRDVSVDGTQLDTNTTSLTSKADKTNVLELDNTTSFTPDADYEPATKKYVDDNDRGELVIGEGLEPYRFTKPSEMFIPSVAMIDNLPVVIGVGADYNRTTGVQYWCSPTGNDTSGDGTEGNPWKNMSKAVSQVDVDEILLVPGLYQRNSLIAVSPTRPISIICPNGIATLGAYDYQTWVLDGTYTNSYRATRSACHRVLDTDLLDNYNLPLEYTVQTTEALVDANPGSWWTDGVTVLVNPATGSSVGDNTAVLMTVATLNIDNQSLYLENLIVIGGLNPLDLNNITASSLRYGAKNCQFLYGNEDGMQVKGLVECITENCISAKHASDGANYNSSGGNFPNIIEIGFKGFANGNGGSGDNDNGSSNHGGDCIRVAGQYFDNVGPNCVDVGSGQTWNVKCEARDSLAAGPNDYDFGIAGEMWLDSCAGDLLGLISGTIYTTLNTRITGATTSRFVGKRTLLT